MEIVLQIFGLSLVLSFFLAIAIGTKVSKSIYEEEGLQLPAQIAVLHNIVSKTSYRNKQIATVLLVAYFVLGAAWLFTFGESIFPFLSEVGT